MNTNISWCRYIPFKQSVSCSFSIQDYSNGTVFDNQSYYVRIYAMLCGGSTLALFVRSFLFFHLFVTASRALHNRMFAAIIRAPMQFFDTNPVGKSGYQIRHPLGEVDNRDLRKIFEI